MTDIELRRKKIRRTRVLQQLHAVNPAAITEQGLLRELKIADQDLNFSTKMLRIELRYLNGHGLCDVEVENNVWTAIITSLGIDFLDGLHECKGLFCPKDLGV